MEQDEKVVRQRFAHALLSPLTVVLGSLDMLLNQNTGWSDTIKEVLQLAMAQTHRLHDTLSDLLETAEVDGDTVRVTWTAAPAPQNKARPPQPEVPQSPEKSQLIE